MSSVNVDANNLIIYKQKMYPLAIQLTLIISTMLFLAAFHISELESNATKTKGETRFICLILIYSDSITSFIYLTC